MKLSKIAMVGLVAIVALALSTATLAGIDVPQDRGASGAWLRMLKLKTTASAMHTTAHPDDEHGGVLSQLSRGDGAALSLLTLNRGESGDNAIGSELFDAVGLIRTEELADAGRYYGLDRQYFTTVIDYGFSKRLEEALDKWGKENVLRDVVRIIRIDRPFVLIARFQGNSRDGHGNHQTAGLVTQEAFKMAGDPNIFPEQIKAGLHAWQPFKVYMGGVRENEDWTIKVDPGVYSPWLGDTFANYARTGLAYQRSQNSGRLTLRSGSEPGYYKRMGSVIEAPAKETSFFDGIDTTLPGLFKTLKRQPPAGVQDLLVTMDREVQAAFAAFRIENPAAAVPALARGLDATRKAVDLAKDDFDATFILRAKLRQFMDAINACLGVTLTATAQPQGTQEPTGPFAAFAPAPTMGPAIPGQAVEVKAILANGSGVEITPVSMTLDARMGVTGDTPSISKTPIKDGVPLAAKFTLQIGENAPLAKPYFSRDSINDVRYKVVDESQIHRPAAAPLASVIARYSVNGTEVTIRETVKRREANLPFGYETRELMVLPRVGVAVAPAAAIIPMSAPVKKLKVDVDLVHNGMDATTGSLALKMPAGWTSAPATAPFSFARAGEKLHFTFDVTASKVADQAYSIEAVATAAGRSYTEGYDVIEHRDLETRYLFHPSTVAVRGVDVKVLPNLKVGYVMGVGDKVPEGLAQLGVKVTLLDSNALATMKLSQFDAIITGTRAYAVREDLKTSNQRLLDYVKAGGNMVVLYNTQEFTPKTLAPFPADLPQRAEEVSEEDSPVTILGGNNQAFSYPNKITPKDFDGWVEQRGSKFFTEWDKAYTPMISTFDKGQEPQKGGWVTATFGQGHYTYFAYAMHRQLPYGVPGAFRLMSNLISLSKTPPLSAKPTK